MARISVFLLAAGCTLACLASAAEKLRAPFVMPPSGKPDALIGGMDLEAPTALAFDSRFTFFEFNTGAEGRYPRAIAVSENDGKSWRLATTAAMVARSVREKRGKPPPAGDVAEAVPQQ